MAQVFKLMHAVSKVCLFKILWSDSFDSDTDKNLNSKDTARLVTLFDNNSVMAKTSEKHMFTLRFLIDEEKKQSCFG